MYFDYSGNPTSNSINISLVNSTIKCSSDALSSSNFGTKITDLVSNNNYTWGSAFSLQARLASMNL